MITENFDELDHLRVLTEVEDTSVSSGVAVIAIIGKLKGEKKILDDKLNHLDTKLPKIYHDK